MLLERRAVRLIRLSTLALFLVLPQLSTLAWGQRSAKKQKSGIEEFEEICPYTKGEKALERKLGYTRVGFIPWRLGDDSRSIQENIGGIPMVWLETEHFKLGSSLGTYKLRNDKREKARFKLDLGRLEKKLGTLKAPKKEIDPWLRLHLYAQMCEDLYAQFVGDFGFTAKDFTRKTPHLGHPKKFLVLLCQKDSEYGRYMRTYLNAETESSFRTGWVNEGMIITASYESVAKDWKSMQDAPVDTMFRCLVTACLTSSFIDGYRDNLYRSPRWLSFATAHIYQKTIDPRWMRFDGRKIVYDADDGGWDWEPRVYKLVKNEFFADNKKLFSFTDYGQMSARDHMIAWSKLTYLMDERGGREGRLKGFLNDVCSPARGTYRPSAEASLDLQTKALAHNFLLTPEEFDQQWKKWVLKTYRKKKKRL